MVFESNHRKHQNHIGVAFVEIMLGTDSGTASKGLSVTLSTATLRGESYPWKDRGIKQRLS